MRIKGYYYRDKDQAFLVSEDMKKSIDSALAQSKEVDTGGRTLYPIFDAPSDYEVRAGKTRVAAWCIKPNQTPTLRWYWQIREHKKSDSRCKPLGGGLCGFKMVRYLDWNASASKWELLPMVNHASSEQEKVLDSN